ncbi:unannotated protein [freshwater metagenome]|uniref:Unannotated protein n=1 Tax=freshwater metagenome TaxID=449393 RepID=A0A6J6TV15_9ZZZZ|nr:SDR family NAD(P)-dependent oxidoreductase [Actinomycetota bacterium]
MALKLDGSKVLITGATSGIGRETAKLLAQLGCVVAITGRRQERLDELETEIKDFGGKVFSFCGDLVDPTVVQNTVAGAADQLDGIDICINNAGLLLTGPFKDAPLEEFDRMLDINLRSLIHVAHAVTPHLINSARTNKNKISDLVNVASAAGRRAVKNSAVYNATKWGTIGFSDTLRMELAGESVRVSLIEPGSVTTEIQNNIRPEIRAIPRPEFSGYDKLESIDIAEAIAFMVTRERRVAISEMLVRPSAQVT